MNEAAGSLVKDLSPHYITSDLLAVSVATTFHWAYKVSLVRSVASEFSIQLTENKSPKQDPISFPSTLSSGEQ